MAVAFSVFGGHNNLDESTENGLDLKSKLQDHISVFQTVTTENKTSDNSDSEMDFRPIDEQFVTVKPESISARYEEIFVNIENMKCLLKLNGLPNDLDQPESEEVSPDTEEWTFECPKKMEFVIDCPMSITDNITSFPDEFPVDYVYNETTNTFIMHTTAKRFVFRSYSSLEAAVVKFIGKIINVSSIESTEPDEVSASVLIMTKPEEDEDKSDNESDYSVEKIILHEDPEEENINTSKTAGIGILEEPEKKKRKTAITCTSDTAKPKDVIESLNTNDSYILVDVKQALQKLAEIPLVDYYLKINTEKPFKGEKKKRTKLIAKLVDVIHNQNEFTTTDEAYGTDIQFLNVGYPTTKCTYCHTNEATQIACYCKDCKIFICDNCLIEHRMKNKYHHYMYQSEILREYKLTNSLEISNDPVMIDLKCMADDIVVILLDDRLCTYNFAGELINSFSISMHQYWKNRIACINNYQIAVTEPAHDLIKIVTFIAPTTIRDLRTPPETYMTGGITCRIDILYVAFTDAIRLIDLSGQIQRVINIPSVELLHSVNNDKMLCVHSKQDSEKTMSCLDFTNDSFNDFGRFPFHPDDVSTDEVGNIIFLKYGVIWQADSDGNNIKIIMSPVDVHTGYKKITYDKDSKCLITYIDAYMGVRVYRKLE
ncbi:unnamed protein product [Mytilus edulis]|uniref:B box-type domain-containing protein n=1 Tax=Mytilus edulis TaxID=6550 RepID=A0A8S3RW63_MYTED|nr:unnamed protein product [Mytilus edulis]